MRLPKAMLATTAHRQTAWHQATTATLSQPPQDHEETILAPEAAANRKQCSLEYQRKED